MTKPLIVVLTGSIGMGKSTTARMFSDLGIPVWDADAAVARLYGPDGAAVTKVVDLVPGAIKNREVDRSVLRRAIAEDNTLLRKLEAVVHPMVAEDRRKFTADNSDADVLLLDIPLYFETGEKIQADKVLVVSASPIEQRARVLARGTMTEDEFELIKSKQMPDAEKRKQADIVFETKTIEDTRAQVQNLVQEMRSAS